MPRLNPVGIGKNENVHYIWKKYGIKFKLNIFLESGNAYVNNKNIKIINNKQGFFNFL